MVVQSQNSGYKITRLCPFIFRLLRFPSSKYGSAPPLPPLQDLPRFLAFQCNLPASSLSPSIAYYPSVFVKSPVHLQQRRGHPSSVRRESAFRRTSGQRPAPGSLSSVLTYESFPPDLCGWCYLVRVWVEGHRRWRPPRLS